jgi:hypothetical protein
MPQQQLHSFCGVRCQEEQKDSSAREEENEMKKLCDCCLELAKLTPVTRYGARIAVDSYRVLGLFHLCDHCDASGCVGDLTPCLRPRCAMCGTFLGWNDPDGYCEPCEAAAWAFGTEADQDRAERLSAIPLPLFEQEFDRLLKKAIR